MTERMQMGGEERMGGLGRSLNAGYMVNEH